MKIPPPKNTFSKLKMQSLENKNLFPYTFLFVERELFKHKRKKKELLYFLL